MYDWPEIREHTDAFWAGLARHAGVTGTLDRGVDHHAPWRQPDLLFSQTCGYPFTHEFKGLLDYIATPHYLADGCDGPHYCSIIFARENQNLSDFYGSAAAINATDSMSGMLALKLACAPFIRSGEFFSRVKITGSHRNSLKAVQTQHADICAIDSVYVALAKKYCPQGLEGLVEIARSPAVPGLPYVTRQDVPLWRAAVLKTFADPTLAKTREALLLGGISVLPEGAYHKILELEEKVGGAA
jgi:ABC-type phosphate/phosphonate transport system substrate-binding protein